jgi:hypothetical protein
MSVEEKRDRNGEKREEKETEQLVDFHPPHLPFISFILTIAAALLINGGSSSLVFHVDFKGEGWRVSLTDRQLSSCDVAGRTVFLPDSSRTFA